MIWLFELNTVVGAGDLVATEGGRSVLSYVITWALPADITLEANQNACTVDDDCKEHLQDGTVNNANPTYTGSCYAGTCRYDFPGNLGLAQEWLHAPLNSTGKGWISACLLARVNLHDTAEEISLRGAHPALTISPDEATLFSVEEGAFYGNLFTPADNPPIEIACRGEGQASGEFGGLVSRDCTEPDPNNPGFTLCGFTFAGDCRDFTPAFPSPFACEKFGPGPKGIPTHGSFYSVCHETPSLGKFPKSGVRPGHHDLRGAVMLRSLREQHAVHPRRCPSTLASLVIVDDEALSHLEGAAPRPPGSRRSSGQPSPRRPDRAS